MTKRETGPPTDTGFRTPVSFRDNEGCGLLSSVPE